MRSKVADARQDLAGGGVAGGSGTLGDALARQCRALLVESLGAATAERGAIFAVEEHDLLRLAATVGTTDAEALAEFERPVLRTLRSGTRRAERHHLEGAGDSTVVVTPAHLGDDLVALVATAGPAQRVGELSAASLSAIALAVDRLRMGSALDDRADEIAALRRQLDAYAVDFRATYDAERERSQELSSALAELESTYRATVRGLAIAVEAKDECTGGHLQRVSRYGMMVTRLVAPEHEHDLQFEFGFLLHDVGKLKVPDFVLAKAGPLTEEEWAIMRAHPESGRTILAGIPFLDGAREIVYSHHERWDGTGYPRRLRAEEIPLGAQIFPLCDAYDAMTNDRPYRDALPVATARTELAEGSGTQFWPAAVEAFLDLPVQELEAIRLQSRQMDAV
jgi:HD-GYP domain-containing protein (c-di-GMP phosphodiesterase class II)